PSRTTGIAAAPRGHQGAVNRSGGLLPHALRAGTMPGAASLFWTAVLLALSSTAIRAQQSTLSNIELTPCCIAPDRHGNNFIVSTSQLPVGSTELPTISVAKTDSTGNVVSQFAF